MKHGSVLIIADHPEFARDVMGHWQLERVVPTFTVLSSELWRPAAAGACDLVILAAGTIGERRRLELLRGLEAGPTPVICVAEEQDMHDGLRHEFARAVFLKQRENWLEFLVLLAAEVLRRADTGAKLKRAEQAAQQQAQQAALGQFMLETRHSFNNALTSVLGNAELMLLEGDKLSPEMREQVDIIHNMALKLHEMMQRFSSIEAEMQFSKRESARADAHAGS